jgi:hypothetical protein
MIQMLTVGKEEMSKLNKNKKKIKKIKIKKLVGDKLEMEQQLIDFHQLL